MKISLSSWDVVDGRILPKQDAKLVLFQRLNLVSRDANPVDLLLERAELHPVNCDVE